jgi:23S rRNA pseudouridine2605 synthase
MKKNRPTASPGDKLQIRGKTRPVTKSRIVKAGKPETPKGTARKHVNKQHPLKTPKKTESAQPNLAGERLQKVLANAGVASRRAAEEMIAAGRVRLNGQVVTEMGVRADRQKDKIEVDGKPVGSTSGKEAQNAQVYIMLNKPTGVVTTARDTHGRRTVLDLLGGAQSGEQRLRLYPVGRLDAETTGLLLITNDGDLTFKLTHPKYGVDKEYRVLVRGYPSPTSIQRLRDGVEIEGELTHSAKVEEEGRQGGNTWLRITIHEGRKRQVRLMVASIGHPAVEVIRVRFGPLTLGSLDVGKWRYLAAHEVHALQKAVKLRPVRTKR